MNLYVVSGNFIFRPTAFVLESKSPSVRRGKHLREHNVTPENVVRKTNEHINAFPRHEPHYSNNRITYLDS